MARFTITLSDETTARLDGAVERLGQNRSTLTELGVALLLDTLEKAALMQSAPDVGAICAKPVVQNGPAAQVEPPETFADAPVVPRGPHFGALPHDTDEILSLLETLNAMPESRATEPELMLLNATRRADVLRQIGKLRRLDAEKREKAAS